MSVRVRERGHGEGYDRVASPGPRAADDAAAAAGLLANTRDGRSE